MEYERSHDIDYLCGLIEDNGLELTQQIKAAVTLTPWAVEFRYAQPLEPNPLDRSDALATVMAVREWADTQIDEKPTTQESRTTAADEPDAG